MRRLLTIVSLLVTIALSSAAQPEATWLEQKHDFGVFLEENGKVHCSLRVVNTGNEPLLIVKAQAGCGCTGINYSESPIKPGDTASVEISYNPSGRPGQFTKQVIIFTNTVIKRTVLEITGHVIPTDKTLDKQYPLKAGSLRISQHIIPFGEITKDDSRTLYLSAYNASTDTLIVSVTGEKTHLKPAVVPDTVPPAKVVAITVHYLSKYAPLWGFNADTISVSCAPLQQPSSAQAGKADIMVMAQVKERFDQLTDKQLQKAPVVSVDCGEQISLDISKKNDVISRTFHITNKGKSELFIRRLWVPVDKGITIKCNKQQLKPGKTATVTVTMDTSAFNEEVINVPLTLLCNDPNSPQTIIRLVGIIE